MRDRHGHRAGVAQSTEIFARIVAVAGVLAQRTGPAALCNEHLVLARLFQVTFKPCFSRMPMGSMSAAGRRDGRVMMALVF